MVFKKISMEYSKFDMDNLNDLQQILDENC